MTLRRVAGLAFAAGLAAVAALTALSFCGPWYYPADFVSHFRLHLAAAALILAVSLLLSGRRRAAFLAAGLVAANLLAVAPERTVPIAQAQPGDLGLTVVTFNLWEFNRDLEDAARMLAETGADIIALQEVDVPTDDVLAALRKEFPWQVECGATLRCDVALLARLPWRATGMIAPDPGHAPTLWATFELDGRVFTVVSTHFDRPHSPRHLRQINGLIESLAGLAEPVILAGDFNATPWSHAMTRLTAGSGLRLLSGLRPTWPARLGLPQLPLDHVLVSPGVRNLGVSLGRYAGSDHLPVIARLAIGGSTATRR